MDIEMAGSFLIGGMILLTILALNAKVLETGSINSLHTMAQENATDIVSILEYDFRKIGHNVPDTTQAIVALSDTALSFLSDIDNDGTVDSIAYRLGPASEVSDTENPNDRYLYGSAYGGEQYVASGLTGWQLTFYDAAGAETVSPLEVRSIGVSFNVETGYPFDETYGRATWEGRITPRNLADQ